MAEEALKKLEEQLKCAICLDTYTDPKLLQCFHVYCRECLGRLKIQDQQGQAVLACPTCRQVTPLPASGVVGLPSAFHINELSDIVKTAHEKTGRIMESYVAPMVMTKEGCSEHDGKDLELYCVQCSELICPNCTLKGQKHHGHEYELVISSFERYKEDISSSIEPIEEQMKISSRSLEELDVHCKKISDQHDTLEGAIHKTIGELQEALNARKTKLISQLHQLTQNKLKRLATQRERIETTQAQLSSCLDFLKESLETDSHGEVLKMKTTIEKRIKELTSMFRPDTFKPITDANITFVIPADIISVCQNYGQVSSPGSPDPSKCYLTGKGLGIAKVGEMSTALLNIINYEGGLCEEPVELLECEFISEISGNTTRCSVERREPNLYEISYQPTIKGRHQLHIKVNNQPIRGSPFTMEVKLPLEKLGTPIATIWTVEEPIRVVVDASGRVVVTEEYKHCVSIFSSKGEKLQSFGKCGSSPGEFNFPRGVAIDCEGNILVADHDNHRIQKFTSDGHFLAAVETGGELLFSRPYDIAFNPSNDRLYVVNYTYRVLVLDSDLTFFNTFGTKGSGQGQFNAPCGIACDSTGNVYVADACNHRIQVFTAEGKFLRMFGRHGGGRGELNRPTGVAVDASDVVYVSEHFNHRVSVFTAEGWYLLSFGGGSDGSKEEEREEGEEGKERGFGCPNGIAVDGTGVVYVCDYDNNNIQLF